MYRLHWFWKEKGESNYFSQEVADTKMDLLYSQKRKSEDLNGEAINGINEAQKENDTEEVMILLISRYDYLIRVELWVFVKIYFALCCRLRRRNASGWILMRSKSHLSRFIKKKSSTSGGNSLFLMFDLFSADLLQRSRNPRLLNPDLLRRYWGASLNIDAVVCNNMNSFSVFLWLIFFSLQTPPPKCLDCRQYLDDPDLKMFQGDPDNAVRASWFQTVKAHQGGV